MYQNISEQVLTRILLYDSKLPIECQFLHMESEKSIIQQSYCGSACIFNVLIAHLSISLGIGKLTFNAINLGFPDLMGIIFSSLNCPVFKNYF